LKDLVKNVFGWTFAPGPWTYERVSRVVDYGLSMAYAIGKITGLDGLAWIRNYIGNAKLFIGPLADKILDAANASGMVPTFSWVLLRPNFNAYTLFHELGHVFDNNMAAGGTKPATWVGGGAADLMLYAMGGNPNDCHPRHNCKDVMGVPLEEWQYINSIAGMDPWNLGSYGNNSVADDFADTFAYTLLTNTVAYASLAQGHPIPQRRYIWMRIYLTSPATNYCGTWYGGSNC